MKKAYSLHNNAFVVIIVVAVVFAAAPAAMIGFDLTKGTSLPCACACVDCVQYVETVHQPTFIMSNSFETNCFKHYLHSLKLNFKD
jgi:hypothetical protein